MNFALTSFFAFAAANLIAISSAESPACTKTAPGQRCAGAEGYELVPWLGGCCFGECLPDASKGYGRWCPEQPSNDPVAVYTAHITALNACDVDALVDLRTDDFTLFLRGGLVLRGKTEPRALWEGACLSFAEGGFRGWEFTAENTHLVGNAYTVQWVMKAPFAEDYRGADAYVSRDGKMASMVSTFDPDAIVYTETRPEIAPEVVG